MENSDSRRVVAALDACRLSMKRALVLSPFKLPFDYSHSRQFSKRRKRISGGVFSERRAVYLVDVEADAKFNGRKFVVSSATLLRVFRTRGMKRSK